MEVQKYLKRLEVEKNSPTLDYLSKLQKYHMEKIPFENLDVTRKVKIELDVCRIYKKVIGHHRGGFCYELNGLFQQLLTKLGFKAHLIACTVNKPTGWAMPNTHAAIMVLLDQPYLVDVGFGDSVRQPVPLTGEERTDVSGTYRVNNAAEGIYDLQRYEEQKWKILYRFADLPKQIGEFTEGCHYNQTSPESTFTHGDIVTIATKTGRITLNGLTVTETKNKQKNKWDLTEEEKKQFLKEAFQITI
ncbi:arylamine N-acetyltransferase [Bacillus sp. DTU_2020_1000418_1_SI_GHA_SEK_038]|uniref:arylamine N-acetyltransferase family protein n=1 Tax=Bacillus sp. DTU_2020_1000418_1_SI_GHA_SEK_038 TaxID=3077585 RepID=UPI0028E9C2BD|nr:arylamine N-acetyltransferase [Bacillus sp. DTU_2020_1000418_1_SI_GHA_SEK_038]WNS77368.1 arylamine N-acetyltransferase [Bacillus sp. DTU_2020_1000418_1_SI_GHA_SEK_038]